MLDTDYLSLCDAIWLKIVLYISQVLPIIFPLKLIYSQIAFYTKYFVLTFSLDVVSTLPNHHASISFFVCICKIDFFIILQLERHLYACITVCFKVLRDKWHISRMHVQYRIDSRINVRRKMPSINVPSFVVLGVCFMFYFVVSGPLSSVTSMHGL